MKRIPIIVIILVCLTACGRVLKPSETEIVIETVTSTLILEPTALPTQTLDPGETRIPSPSPVATLAPDAWKSLPVVPVGVSRRMVEIYQNGLARGRDPKRFSKFGDCQNVPSYFLTMFDTGDYRLGEQYAYLQPTIDHFAGSWQRNSLAVIKGSNVASIQTSFWTDTNSCEKNETPMECEIRKNNPSLVLISFETWWGDKPAPEYESRLRSMVKYVLSQDVVPILATKADNTEGDNSINAAIARVATEYELPLWNFWAATYPLPEHGLTADGFHLTFARDFFDDPLRMEMAWPWRNLTALQSIDAVYRSLNNIH
jgi:hypothetical protein